MASSPALADGANIPAPAAKTSLVTLIVAIFAAVILSIAAVGGSMVYLIRSGRLPVQKTITVPAEAPPPGPAAPSHSIMLDSLVANLADAGGAAYLKMSLTVKVADEPVKKGAKEEKAAPKGVMSDDEAGVRDTVLSVVGHQTAEGLLAADGKEHLKSELKAALAKNNPELKVMDIHFTDFLVQR